MIDLLPILTSIALVDSTSITPLALVPLMHVLAGPRGYQVAGAFLLGLYLSYLVMALAFLFGLSALFLRVGDWVAYRWHHPEPLDFGLELVVGLLLLYFALRRRDPRRERAGKKSLDGAVSPGQAFKHHFSVDSNAHPGPLRNVETQPHDIHGGRQRRPSWR